MALPTIRRNRTNRALKQSRWRGTKSTRTPKDDSAERSGNAPICPRKCVLEMDDLRLLVRQSVDTHNVEPHRRRHWFRYLSNVGSSQPPKRQLLMAIDC